MKTYIVSENKRTNLHRRATIEARDAEEARAKFHDMQVAWDSENSGTEFNVQETLGSSMLGGEQPTNGYVSRPY